MIRVQTRTVADDGLSLRPRAVYEAVSPSMDASWLADGRGDLLHPTVLWRHGREGWRRASCVVEASVARRWLRSWSRGEDVYAITSAARLSRCVRLPLI